MSTGTIYDKRRFDLCRLLKQRNERQKRHAELLSVCGNVKLRIRRQGFVASTSATTARSGEEEGVKAPQSTNLPPLVFSFLLFAARCQRFSPLINSEGQRSGVVTAPGWSRGLIRGRGITALITTCWGGGEKRI